MKSAERLILLTLSIMIMVLSGCVSQEEKDKGDRLVKLAEPIITQYVKENYSNYEVESIKDIYSVDGLLKSKATDYVKATLDNKNEDFKGNKNRFNLILDTKRNSLYSDYNSKEILKVIENKLALPKECNVKIFFVIKSADDSIIDLSNYLAVGNEKMTEYRLFLFIECKDNKHIHKIYSSLDNIKGFDYEAKIITGELTKYVSTPSSIRYWNNSGEDDLNIIMEGSIITISNIDGNTNEKINVFKKKDIESGYIVYDAINYDINAYKTYSKSLTEDKEKSTNDIQVDIKTINKKDSSKMNIYSNKYNDIVYTDSNNKIELHMSKVNLLNPDSLSYISLDISGLKDIVFAMYESEANVKEKDTT